MGHDDRFRGQDPDHHEYDTPASTSTSDDDEPAMRQDQGGRPPAQEDGYVYGQDDLPTDMGGGTQYKAPDEDGTFRHQEDELGTYEGGEPPDDDTEGSW